ncbi:MAG: cytochrome c [Syntrophobacteraceae bacterium]
MKTALWLTVIALALLSPAPFLNDRALGQTAPPKTSELLSKGAKLYGEKCAGCHGSQGNGHTPMEKILNPPPRDFTLPLNDWTVTRGSPAKIFKVISEGIPDTSMMKFPLADEDVWALVYTVMGFSRG